MADSEEAPPVKAEPLSPSHIGIKRRASASPSPEAETIKRARVSDTPQEDAPRDDGNRRSESPRRDRRDSHNEPDRPRPPVNREEEKKRGRRLFGGLLNTLSQSKPSAQQNKRREIEQRQQEKVQKQKAEDDKRLAERLGKINSARRADQIYFDEKVMRTRHSNLLARAHSLCTKSEPRIYYRPWKLTADQEDIIDDQIADAKDIVAREEDDFAHRRDEHERRFGRRRRRSPMEARRDVDADADRRRSPDAPARTPARERSVEMAEPETEPQPVEPAPEAPKQTGTDALDKDHDEPGDVVVDNEEDMVMY